MRVPVETNGILKRVTQEKGQIQRSGYNYGTVKGTSNSGKSYYPPLACRSERREPLLSPESCSCNWSVALQERSCGLQVKDMSNPWRPSKKVAGGINTLTSLSSCLLISCWCLSLLTSTRSQRARQPKAKSTWVSLPGHRAEWKRVCLEGQMADTQQGWCL